MRRDQMDENYFYDDMSGPYRDGREWHLSDDHAYTGDRYSSDRGFQNYGQLESRHDRYYPSEHDREIARNYTSSDNGRIASGKKMDTRRPYGRSYPDPQPLRTFSPMKNHWNSDYGNSMYQQGMAGRTWAGSERADMLNEEARAARSRSSFGHGFDTSYGTGSTYGSSYYSSGRNDERSEGHYGKGPKGWRRSDEKIREEVCEGLYRDRNVDASSVEVSVKDGCVTLSGSVDSRSAKRAAEDCIEKISGVEDVQNELRVKKDNGLIGEGQTYTRGNTSTDKVSRAS